MRALTQRLPDLGLLALGVVVAVAASMALAQSHSAAAPTRAAASPAPSPTAPTVVVSTPAAAAAPVGPIVLVGADLAPQAGAVGHLLDADVVTAPASSYAVVTAAALQTVIVTPTIAVLQVQPGAHTTPRTKAAIALVERTFPGVAVYVVGPFDPRDGMSEASVRAAVEATPGVVFLDPIAAHWTSGSSGLAARLAAARKAPAA